VPFGTNASGVTAGSKWALRRPNRLTGSAHSANCDSAHPGSIREAPVRFTPPRLVVAAASCRALPAATSANMPKLMRSRRVNARSAASGRYATTNAVLTPVIPMVTSAPTRPALVSGDHTSTQNSAYIAKKCRQTGRL